MDTLSQTQITNARIAELFYQYAELLEVSGADPRRTRAYRMAARMIAAHDEAFARMVARGDDLVPLPTIGEAIAAKIEAIVRTGRFEALDQLERRMDPVRVRLLKVEGVGPKRLREIERHLGGNITVDGLVLSSARGELARLRGIGAGVEAAIHEAFSELI